MIIGLKHHIKEKLYCNTFGWSEIKSALYMSWNNIANIGNFGREKHKDLKNLTIYYAY